jgi:hypothetical protein
LFRAISRWAARSALTLPESSKHIWKPNVLVPVLTTNTLSGNFPLIKAIVAPLGTMTVLGIKLTKDISKNPEEKTITKTQLKNELEQLPNLVEKFGKTGIFTFFSTVEAKDYIESLVITLGVVKSQVFPPNILFLPFKPRAISKTSLEKITVHSKKNKMGLAIFDRHNEIGLGSEQDIHVWISPKVLKEDFYGDRYFDLALLLAYEIDMNWKGKIVLRMVTSEDKKKEAKRYLKRVIYESRFPAKTEIQVDNGALFKTIDDCEEGDLHIIPFVENELDKILKITQIQNKSFLFVMDSSKEDIFA